jgi:hypothetical protein
MADGGTSSSRSTDRQIASVCFSTTAGGHVDVCRSARRIDSLTCGRRIRAATACPLTSFAPKRNRDRQASFLDKGAVPDSLQQRLEGHQMTRLTDQTVSTSNCAGSTGTTVPPAGATCR